jgi:septal ring factor EnvC (AmiA/AmiB activator)
VRRLSLALVLALALPAEAKRHKQEPPPPPPDPRPALSDQLAAESTALGQAMGTVADKLARAEQLRLRHLRAAARILHAPLPADATPDDRMAFARRRAAARLLLDRDLGERALLAQESARLHAADIRLTHDTSDLAALSPPAELAWPARGTVTRHFGPFEHERSRATLSRRGIDLEVDDHAPAVAPADGIVAYAGPIRGLDHGVILDHGDYLTIVAKLSEPSLPVGAHVVRGDRIGRAARHRIYLELRAKIGPGGLPVDPEPYLAR